MDLPVSPALNRITPQSGVGFSLRKGELLRVIDPLGYQVCDLIAFARADSAERLSTGRTIDYAGTIYISTGDVLYSCASNPMLTIVGDDVGRHDLLLAPCSQRMFEKLYGVQGHHPNCEENLVRALAPFGVPPALIGETFNVFMDVSVGADGTVCVNPPRSRSGDAIVLRAEMDLYVGLTACSAEISNAFAFKPVDWAVEPPSATG